MELHKTEWVILPEQIKAVIKKKNPAYFQNLKTSFFNQSILKTPKI